MKKTLNRFAFTVLAAVVVLTSCQKDSEITPSNQSNNSHRSSTITCGEATTVALLAGQHINVGTVTVTNDETNLYVTYNTTGGWKLTELHLFAGACNQVPVTKQGNPIPGHFPYSANPASLTSYTFTIPLANLENCFCVASHAVVRSSSGGTETAWGQGQRFVQKGNWAMKFNACKQECVVDEGCVEDVSTFFGRDASAWPVSSVTVGGYTYSQAEGTDIYNNQFSSSTYAFSYIALIELSGTVPANAPIRQHINVVNAWLATIGKVSATNQQNAPANVQSSIDAIYDFVNNRFCNE